MKTESTNKPESEKTEEQYKKEFNDILEKWEDEKYKKLLSNGAFSIQYIDGRTSL